MTIAKINVTALADTTGILLVNKPNNNHNKVPKANKEYMNKDMPEVFFVRMVLMACGKKEMVVQAAAASPNMVV